MKLVMMIYPMYRILIVKMLGERQMGIYQGLSEYKPETQASASILAYTRLRFGLVLVSNYLPLALLIAYLGVANNADAQTNDPSSVAGAKTALVQAKAEKEAGQNRKKNSDTKPNAERKKAKRPAAVGPAINENKATPLDRIKVKEGFKAELLYSIPGGEQGSWVNLCLDNRGRILASDQYGGLYRFAAPPAGQVLDPTKVEKLPLEIRAANGMVWAFGALYVGVNDYEDKIPSGLYRITDSNDDDELDKVECLRAMEARGDHGVHAVVPTPDGKALYLITGNGTKPTEAVATSPVPANWGEDHLLPRLPDGRGFMRDVLAPGGIIYRVSPDGKSFERVANGFRNIFDASVNREGELFTYDADMEYDFNTSWYRPTRVNHVVSGAEFGWRNGAGKRPEFYPDNLPATVNIGPGSPTGTAFGYGAKFPAKYQNALYVLDWSWGKMYAVHLKPDGASYTGEKEEFVSGTPLPLTDCIINPADGAMYFTIGGRRVQSGLYRVTYVGSESTAPINEPLPASPAVALRKKLEAFHGRQDPRAIEVAWAYLADPDRFIRWAARIAIEHQPLANWAERAFSEQNPAAKVEALMAVARSGGVCPPHRTADSPPVNQELAERLLDALVSLDASALTAQQQQTWIRTIQIALNRFGMPGDNMVRRLTMKLDARFPASSFELNWLLAEALVFLQSPSAADKIMRLIADAPTQEEQIEYARSLRMLKAGWNTALRTAYFEWFLKAANYRGGASFEKFIEFIRNDAVANLTEVDRETLKDVLAKAPQHKNPIENVGAIFAGRTPKVWTVDDLAPSAATKLTSRNFDNGRKMFGAAACFTCHRFGNSGGMNGPDLTSAGRRYSPKDLIEQVIDPSKEINEQFVPIDVVTTEGDRYRGVVVNLNGDTLSINTDAADPNQRVTLDRKEVVSIAPSKVSPMPKGLFDVMTETEILDLLAYVISGGDSQHAAFRKP